MNGVLVGGITAVISGISVFANSYGVHHVASPSVYTTAKNLVAFVILGAGALAAGDLEAAAPAGVMAARWVGGTRSDPRSSGAPSRGWGWPMSASSAVGWRSCSSSTGLPAPRPLPPPSCMTAW